MQKRLAVGQGIKILDQNKGGGGGGGSMNPPTSLRVNIILLQASLKFQNIPSAA